MASPNTQLDRLARPLENLRISVTDRCNFRCPYCMPAELFNDAYEFIPREELLSFEEIARLTRIFTQIGVRRVRITGGEPLLRAHLDKLVTSLRKLDAIDDLALTTNGVLLPKHVTRLKEAGLDRITISLDALDPEIFRQLSGRKDHPDRVFEGLAAAEQAGFSSVKINCVVKKGVNDQEILPLVDRFRGTQHILRFIEYMDVGTMNGWELSQVMTAREIRDIIHHRYPLTPIESDVMGRVARDYAFTDGQGTIGIIASVTEPFCGGCTRARLTIQGELVTCLFASSGIDLKTPLRSGANDDELLDVIRQCWTQRNDRYSEQRTADTTNSNERIEMFRLGG